MSSAHWWKSSIAWRRRPPRSPAWAGTQAPTRARRGGTSSKARTPAAARRGRPRGSGNRAKQALELVRARPGITISEMASAMGIKANYLYRVMPTLQKEGQVKKRDKGWHPA